MKRVLLISNSTLYGSGYLDHAESELRDFLGPDNANRVCSVCSLRARQVCGAGTRSVSCDGIRAHIVARCFQSTAAVAEADAVFVGGGNTFRLLKGLYDFDLLEPIRQAVAEGLPYVGSSAGAIVAGPSLRTTKDMPVVQPPSFAALGLVDFQISPHYLDPDPCSTHMGETQEERILQFLEENDAPVAGLREGAMLRIENEPSR